MNEKEEINVNDMANALNMLCLFVSAKMEITMHHDEVTVSGGTAIDLVDLYIVIKAVGRRCMPMMKSADDLKHVIKSLVDFMDFTDEAEHKEDTP